MDLVEIVPRERIGQCQPRHDNRMPMNVYTTRHNLKELRISYAIDKTSGRVFYPFWPPMHFSKHGVVFVEFIPQRVYPLGTTNPPIRIMSESCLASYNYVICVNLKKRVADMYLLPPREANP